MAPFFPPTLENLIDKFASLPGVGKKSAQRLAFYVLSLPEAKQRALPKQYLRQKRAFIPAPNARTLPTETSVPSAAMTDATRALSVLFPNRAMLSALSEAANITVSTTCSTVFCRP